MNTNADITVYNRWFDRATRTDRWLRVQLRSVNWYGGQAAKLLESGLVTADEYTVRIPLQAAPDERRYVTPEEYVAADEDALAGLWTLQRGDIVVRGLIDVNITAPAQVTVRSNSFVVNGTADNRRGGLPHWKVVGA